MLQTFKILASQNQSKIIAFVKKYPLDLRLDTMQSEMGKTLDDLERLGYYPALFDLSEIELFSELDHQRIKIELTDDYKRCYFIYDEDAEEIFKLFNRPPKSSDELILMWKKLLKSYENLIVVEEVPQEEALTFDSVVAFAPALIELNSNQEYREFFDEIKKRPIMIVFDDCHTFKISMIAHLD